MSQLLLIDFIFIVAALLVSIIAMIEKREPSRLSLLLLLSYLTIVNGARIFDFILLSPKASFILSNVSLHLEIVFYAIIFYFLIQGNTRKLFLKIFFFIFSGFTIINALFIQSLDVGYSNYSFILGSVFILVSILFYFYEQLQDDGYRFVFKNFWVWYAAALFVFLATEIPFMSILNHYLETKADFSEVLPIVKLKIIISSFYYLSFSLAYFLCRKTT